MQRAENINPAILAWARETAGLSVEEAADRIGLTSSARGSAVDKLQALESGGVKPTRNQLLKIASVYRRPLTAFYRAAPPRTGDRGEDFRTLAGPVSREETGLLDALLRDIRARQDMVRSILEEDEDVRELEFVGSMTIDEPVSLAAGRIRETLGVNGQERFWGGRSSPDDLFSALRARTESIGVFVLLAGNLGSHHTNISEQVFRGLLLQEEVDQAIFNHVIDTAYAPDLTDSELEEAGRDPFLVTYACMGPERAVVTKEIPKPTKIRGRRKLPDACEIMDVPWMTDFRFYRERDFRIS